MLGFDKVGNNICPGDSERGFGPKKLSGYASCLCTAIRAQYFG